MAARTDVWAVQLRGVPGTEEEVAAVFASRSDATAYATWWNREELRRYGDRSTATAVIEETDFYEPGGWRQPARPYVVPTNRDPRTAVDHESTAGAV